jgi:hypothetical protein
MSSEGTVKKKRRCPALDRSVTVVEVYVFQSSGACPVTSALTDLQCDGESECRKRALYKDCDLWDEYKVLFD